jgi:hypothetical protein
VYALTIPLKFVLAPKVTELPTFQKTLHGVFVPLMILTTELALVNKVVPIWKTQTGPVLLFASKVKVPVIVTVVVKQ